MGLRGVVTAGLLGVALAAWAAPAQTAAAPVDPFYLPPEARAFAQRVAMVVDTDHLKMREVLRGMFRAPSAGGMGLTYDNGHTRTVEEVWRDGKANCLSMTAFYVAACRALKLPCTYAEALNTNHWRKVGNVIRYERHVVALAPCPPNNDLIADFVPNLRKRFGTYVVAVVPENRFRALFYSNRAVEALSEGDLTGAKDQAQLSLDADPKSSVGWNVLGVVEVAMGEKDQAEAAYRKAMALDPRDGAPLGNMETLLRDSGRMEEAGVCRRLAEKVRKKDPYFHAFLAEDALSDGNLEEAETRVRMALRLEPREADFHLLLARVKLAAGDLEGASKGIQDAKELANPLDRERYDWKLAYIQGLQGNGTKR